MFVVYHPGYTVDLGPNHRFPMQKYAMVYARLRAEGTLARAQLVPAAPAALADVLLVHTRDYVERFLAGAMSPQEMRLLGFPWSAPLARRARLATQGTITASRLAWQHGLAANLAGGSHHAFADHGEGFSVFNDMAIAIRVLQRDHGLQRAAIIDCDVHQGNGTATIFAGDPAVFTCSLHGAKNYPFHKAKSSLDIELPDGTEDAAYLAALQHALPSVLARFQPQMIWYLAGVDPYMGDKLGRMALTLAGLRQRDAYVLETCYQAGVPVVTTMGGGYAREIDDIVEAHCNTVRLACQL
ncbi:MAG: histone deacetylase, partial [Candidatus Tectomicrobia bacterium]|nr:histone deacetylase [Candidatus Tectomicrobia bacterium]